MKKKPITEPVISPEILEMSKPASPKKCAVCGTESTPLAGPQSPDDLCWVCRRLKISAWRDTDQQMAAQE
jgi:hypothetical protein